MFALFVIVYAVLFFIVNQCYNQLIAYQNRRLTVYVKNNASADTRVLADDIRLETGAVKSQYVSKDEALKKIESETGSNVCQ